MVGSLLAWRLSAEELAAAWNTINLACDWFSLSYAMATTCLFISASCVMLAIAVHADRELNS
jgi:hypothetical protein